MVKFENSTKVLDSFIKGQSGSAGGLCISLVVAYSDTAVWKLFAYLLIKTSKTVDILFLFYKNYHSKNKRFLVFLYPVRKS